MSRYSKIVKKKKKKSSQFIPERWQVFVARRLIDGTAVFLLLSGLALLLAFTSYSHTDPSWNTASGAGTDHVSNWLGLPGAYMADVLLQTIGLGGVVWGIIFGTWGVRVLSRQKIGKFWLRFVMAIAASLCAAVAFARLPAGAWLLHPWLGGSAGTIILDRLSAVTPAFFQGYQHSFVAVLAGLTGFLAFLYAVALSKAEMLFFFRSVFRVLTSMSAFVMQTFSSFYGWISHYGDPDYAFSSGKKTKAVREKKIKPQKAVILEDVNILEQSPVAASAPSDIRVVSPHQASGETVSVRQTNFTLDTGEWELPPSDMLTEAPPEEEGEQLDEAALRQNAEMLQNVLADFSVSGDIVSIHPGPVVTLYELEPSPGIKTSRVVGLSDDIARSMSAISVRCAVVPGRSVIGIELPNEHRQTVYLRQILETAAVAKNKAQLPLILGKDIGGHPVIADLARMPHLLVAGTTGSGKSVAINTMILSLLYHLPPEKCRFIMIDPKMLELSVYDGIPHLLSPVVTEPGKAVVSLKWAVQEMEERYRAMSKLGVRNIEGYNARLKEARKSGETLMRKVQTGFDSGTGKPVYEEQPLDTTDLPYIVIVVDEFADLMLVAGKDVEGAVQRLAQMARAAGIHLIMATQRPSVNVITGVIKANFPTRISFQVTSKVDSRTILNEGGAEQLLGMGDMLYMASGGQAVRVHGPFVSDDDVESVVSFLKAQGEPAYLDEITEGGDFGDSEVMGALFGGGDGGNDSIDEFYDKAVALVARERKASTSFIQRYFQVGYNRAARMIEEMEKQGIISPATATGKREVLISDFSDA